MNVLNLVPGYEHFSTRGYICSSRTARSDVYSQANFAGILREDFVSVLTLLNK